MNKYLSISMVAMCVMVSLLAIPVANTRAMQTGVGGSGRQTPEPEDADAFFNDTFARFLDDPQAVSEFDTDWILRHNLLELLWGCPKKNYCNAGCSNF